MSSRSRTLCIAPWTALALSVILGFAISFHVRNHGYHFWDEMHYVETAQGIYRTYRADGLLNALKAAYVDRGWKPILHPAFGAPALFLTGGRILPAIAVSSAFFFTAFLAGAGFIFLEFLDSFSAALAVLLIGGIPFIYLSGIRFMSEIYFLAFSTWAVFFLLRSGNLSNRKMTCAAGIFLGLAACTRPVEVPLNLGILLTLFAAVLYRKKQLRLGRVLEFAFFSLILPVLWFAPKFHELKFWILDNTADPDLPRAGISFLRSASFQLGAPVVILLLSWVWVFTRDRVPRPYKWALACFGANWVGGLLAGSLTKNGDFRYYEFSTVLLTGWLLVCCLGNSSDWRARIARAGVSGVALLQLFHLGTYVFGADSSGHPLQGWFWDGAGSLSPVLTEDHRLSLVKTVAQALAGQPRARILIVGAVQFAGDDLEDKTSLNVLARELELPISFRKYDGAADEEVSGGEFPNIDFFLTPSEAHDSIPIAKIAWHDRSGKALPDLWIYDAKKAIRLRSN